ncbi:MAG: glycosyltransferase family 4 protein, partial [Planctomycetes bacterium]|nr:glycosyltransferase family 4 protein [Planctomycetota bacterium]
MRIALVNKEFSRSRGGGERYAADLAEALAALGHEVLLFGHVFAGLNPGLRLCPVDMPGKPGWLRNLWFCRAAAAALRERRAEYDVSCALTPAYPVDACLLGGGVNRHWLRVRFASPLKEWLYGHFSLNHWAQNSLEAALCRPGNCRLIIANSELVRGHLLSYLNVDPGRVAVLPNAVDDARFNPSARERFRAESRAALGLAEGDVAIVYSATNWERKGLATLVRALGRLGDGRYRAVVFGAGDAEKYRALAARQGLGERQLVFAGYVADPARAYAVGDLSVLPTRYDTFGNVVTETMALGMPAITTAQAGAAEIIANGESGFVLERADDDAAL